MYDYSKFFLLIMIIALVDILLKGGLNQLKLRIWIIAVIIFTVNTSCMASGSNMSKTEKKIVKTKEIIKTQEMVSLEKSAVIKENTAVKASSQIAQPMLDAGNSHNVVLKSDGTVWTWGQNKKGQLGDGTLSSSKVPVKAKGLSDVVMAAAGSEHTVALKKDGTVWCWGSNFLGQLGDGSRDNKNVPVKVKGIEGVKAVAAGGKHTVALKKDGTVWCWGDGQVGQLGNGMAGSDKCSTKPVKVEGLSDITAIDAGCDFFFNHTVALRKDGTVWTWGWNEYGALGDGTTTKRTKPVQVKGIKDVKAIAAGFYHTVAVKTDGTVWAWGYNAVGQLGTGGTTNKLAPQQVYDNTVFPITGVVSVAAGAGHTVALKSDGTMLAWGHNRFGQVGDGTTVQKNCPAAVKGISGVTGVSAGEAYTLALRKDGTVWCWGWNEKGELGAAAAGNSEDVVIPQKINGVNSAGECFAGSCFSEPGAGFTVLKKDGTVWSWGKENMSPEQLPDMKDTTFISSDLHTLVLKTDGTVWAWGEYGDGQLGDGSMQEDTGPNQLDSGFIKKRRIKVSGLTGVTSISVGSFHSVALKKDGTVWTWGENGDGQLGDGTTADRSKPVKVAGLRDVTAVAAEGRHTMALTKEGTVWTWGWNKYYQLGDGTNINRTKPVKVSGLKDVKAISSGEGHSLALKKDGTIWAWGGNFDGQAGDGTDHNKKSSPVKVKGLSGVKAVVACPNNNFALISDGTLWAWGDNECGQLGDGTKEDRDTPVKVKGLTGVISFDGTYNSSIAVKNDGSVWCWGNNKYGQMGHGTALQIETPVQFPDLKLFK